MQCLWVHLVPRPNRIELITRPGWISSHNGGQEPAGRVQILRRALGPKRDCRLLLKQGNPTKHGQGNIQRGWRGQLWTITSPALVPSVGWMVPGTACTFWTPWGLIPGSNPKFPKSRGMPGASPLITGWTKQPGDGNHGRLGRFGSLTQFILVSCL